MKLSTWNIERLKHKSSLTKILQCCQQTKSNILVLTETDTQVCPKYKYYFQTPNLTEIAPTLYKSTENRVTIYTDYKCVCQHKTYDKYTAICVELETELGSLLVYGTIIGVQGNRRSSFMEDLKNQLADIEHLSHNGKKLCICGDFNCSFADNYYFTKDSRNLITECFSKNNITLLTKDRPECIDHIAISEKLVVDKQIEIEEWNYDKTLSDHKGIAVKIT